MDERLTDNPNPAPGPETSAGQAPPTPVDAGLTDRPAEQATAPVGGETIADRRADEISSLLDAADGALATGRWRQARAALGVALEDSATLPHALRERLATTTLAVAVASEGAGHWRAAGDLLRQLLALGLATEAATAGLEDVRRGEEGQAALARAQSAFAAGRWQSCLDAAEAALVGLPASMAARELRLLAVSELEKEEKKRRRAAMYRAVPATLLRLGSRAADLTGQGLRMTVKALGMTFKALGELRPAHTPPPPRAAAAEAPAAAPAVEPAAPAAAPRRQGLGELPPEWELTEMPGEAAAQDTDELGAVLGLGSTGATDVALVRHYIENDPTADEAYCWLARHYLLREKFAEGRQTLDEGLGRCPQRRRLCQLYGWLELEAGRLEQAANWWLRSARLQLAARHPDTQEPFLYLGYLALLYGHVERADQFFVLVDGAQNLQLSESGKEELRALAAKANKQVIVEGISALGRCLDERQ